MYKRKVAILLFFSASGISGYVKNPENVTDNTGAKLISNSSNTDHNLDTSKSNSVTFVAKPNDPPTLINPSDLPQNDIVYDQDLLNVLNDALKLTENQDGSYKTGFNDIYTDYLGEQISYPNYLQDYDNLKLQTGNELETSRSDLLGSKTGNSDPLANINIPQLFDNPSVNELKYFDLNGNGPNSKDYINFINDAISENDNSPSEKVPAASYQELFFFIKPLLLDADISLKDEIGLSAYEKTILSNSDQTNTQEGQLQTALQTGSDQQLHSLQLVSVADNKGFIYIAADSYENSDDDILRNNGMIGIEDVNVEVLSNFQVMDAEDQSVEEALRNIQLIDVQDIKISSTNRRLARFKNDLMKTLIILGWILIIAAALFPCFFLLIGRKRRHGKFKKSSACPEEQPYEKLINNEV